jgi:hypothetical protein
VPLDPSLSPQIFSLSINNTMFRYSGGFDDFGGISYHHHISASTTNYSCKCTKCGNTESTGKKRYNRVQRGKETFVCGPCKSQNTHSQHCTVFTCCKCHKTSNQFTKGARKKARNGDPVACKICIEADEQAKRKRQNEAHERKMQEYRDQRQRDIDFRLDNHPMPPPHPDDGKYTSWTPNQTMTIQSGGFGFCLSYEIQTAATKPLYSFEEMA